MSIVKYIDIHKDDGGMWRIHWEQVRERKGVILRLGWHMGVRWLCVFIRRLHGMICEAEEVKL